MHHSITGKLSLRVNSVDTYFVYDIMGNVIAEYEKVGTGDATWTRDYVYGGAGEAVYMKFPQTTTTNNEFDNFVEFAEAWLCEPNCTTADLDWDIDDSNNVDLVDFALSVLDFDDGFTINGRYLLTDFRNSVIGKVNLDGSVDEISYDAWGTPSIAVGADLEGLSILWDGYYYDDETDNYYLRNRYYSPLERKFITEDPHGTNPDGTWNNWFSIQRQYQDGYGLSVYVQGDPVNGTDPWGLKSVCCKIKTTSSSWFGTKTSCTQITLDMGEGTASPINYCKCRFRYFPNTSVYDAGEDKCCWCKISIDFIGHTRVRVDCKDDSFIVHVYPDTFAAWDGGATVHVEDPGDDVYDGYYIHTVASNISCEQADLLRLLDGEPWSFSPIVIPGVPGDGNCFQFASALYKETTSACP